MGNSQDENLNDVQNLNVDFKPCPFKYCTQGPFTKASLYYHLLQHYKKGVARKLVECIFKEGKN